MTVYRVNPGGNLVPLITVVTATDGTYTIPNLPSGVALKVVPDTTGTTLNGYAATENSGEVDYPAGLTTDQTDVDFGYYTPAPTIAIIAGFRSYLDGGQVMVEWQTLSERGTVGFYLERKDVGSDRFQRVNQALLPGLLSSPVGGTYRYADGGAEPGGSYVYRLVEAEFRGGQRYYGPFEVTVEGPAVKSAVSFAAGDGFESMAAADDGFESMAVGGDRFERKAHKSVQIQRKATTATLFAAVKSAAQDDLKAQIAEVDRQLKQLKSELRQVQRELRKAETAGQLRTLKVKQRELTQAISDLEEDRKELVRRARREGGPDPEAAVGDAIGLKIPVTAAGIHLITAAEIAAGFDAEVSEATSWIGSGELQLLNNGQPVAWYADSDDSGLYFYGEGIDSAYGVANIYQLKKGRRYAPGEAQVTGASATEMSAGFVVERHVEEDRIDLPWIYNDSEADIWIWADLSGNELWRGIGPDGFDVPTPGALSGQPARLTVNMEAWVNSNNVDYQYAVDVAVNDQNVGTLTFTGGVALQESVEFPAGGAQ